MPTQYLNIKNQDIIWQKNCVIYNTYTFFDFKRYTRNPSVNMYLLMYVEET